MRAVLIPLCALLNSLAALPVHANPDVISREYKLLLDPGKFTYSSESSTVSSYYSAARSQIQTAINRWVSTTAQTKTPYAYNLNPTFCQ